MKTGNRLKRFDTFSLLVASFDDKWRVYNFASGATAPGSRFQRRQNEYFNDKVLFCAVNKF
jgi:hypothetical protein